MDTVLKKLPISYWLKLKRLITMKEHGPFFLTV